MPRTDPSGPMEADAQLPMCPPALTRGTGTVSKWPYTRRNDRVVGHNKAWGISVTTTNDLSTSILPGFGAMERDEFRFLGQEFEVWWLSGWSAPPCFGLRALGRIAQTLLDCLGSFIDMYAQWVCTPTYKICRMNTTAAMQKEECAETCRRI